MDLKGNARVIIIRTYADDNSYLSAKKALNLGILRLLEEEGIDRLHTYLVTDPKTNKQMMQELSNVDLN